MRYVLSLVCLLVLPLLTTSGQTRAGVLVPAGARIRIEGAGKEIEGSLVRLGRDSVVVSVSSPGELIGRRSATAMEAVSGIRVLESPELWRRSTTSSMTFFMGVTVPASLAPAEGTSEPDGAEDMRHVLLVGTGTELSGVDPESGKTIWTRNDLPNLGLASIDLVGRTGFGVVTVGDTMEIIDLSTGAKQWRTDALSLAAKGWLPSGDSECHLLLYGRTAQSQSTLMLVDLVTGAVQWRQDSLFRSAPKVFGFQGVSYLLGHQEPVNDTDSTLLVYISKDGPVRLNARTGALIWRASVLDDAGVPAPRDGYSRILQSRGVFYVPSGNRLWALNREDGRPLWNPPRQFRNKVIRMESTRLGLLVRGEEWIDLIAPETGRSIWPQPVSLKSSTRMVLRGDTIFVGSDDGALVIGMADGSARSLAKVHFKEREHVGALGVLDEGVVLNSWHNLTMVDRQGSTVYQEFYPSPGESLGEGLLSGMIGSPIYRPTTRWSGGDIYFFTGRPDQADREGFSIVKFDAARGREISRVWLDDRNPSYALDPSSGSVYYQRSGRELVGLKFPDLAALANAAMNGHTDLIERLLAMGVDVKTSDRGRWTALPYAAWAGQLETARKLVSAGADVNAATDQDWTPWMLASRQGFEELADTLRSAGALHDDTTALILRGWHHASEGRITEALALYTEAHAADSMHTLFPRANLELCWKGALNDRANDVLAVCDRAVNQARGSEPRQRALFARSVARALSANLAGAAADLTESAGAQASGQVASWIEDLGAERNPFTPPVLAGLRRR
jgi:outer membrane protein assembly factor BamB